MTTAADIKSEVKERYGKIAASATPSTGGGCGCCCGSTDTAAAMSKSVGYSDAEIGAVPEGANLGLGCGNPTALAALAEGETVVDLGSGGGFDAFLAARAVGESGKVIGVDMTPEMIARATENAKKGGYTNVEFRLGEIEDLPLADNKADTIISNCVINLSTDKPQVFREAMRVLKPGGRLMVSDLVLLEELPESIRTSMAAYAGCIAGAMLKEEYLGAMQDAGFTNIELKDETGYPIESLMNDPALRAIAPDIDEFDPEDVRKGIATVVSIKVVAHKPAACCASTGCC